MARRAHGIRGGKASQRKTRRTTTTPKVLSCGRRDRARVRGDRWERGRRTRAPVAPTPTLRFRGFQRHTAWYAHKCIEMCRQPAGSRAYSSNPVEWSFSEVRLEGVLGSWTSVPVGAWPNGAVRTGLRGRAAHGAGQSGATSILEQRPPRRTRTLCSSCRRYRCCAPSTAARGRPAGRPLPPRRGC
jgi:hypothetical protein